MPETDKSTSFTLSYAHNHKEERFTSAAAAGRAFADADASQRPRVIEATEKSARTVAHTVTIGRAIQKSVPTLDSVRKDLTDLNRDGAAPSRMTQTNMDFWTGYHERVAEKASPDKASADQGSISPSEKQKAKPDQDRFDLPVNYHDRFLVTKAKGQQDLYRSYDDARPAIIDKGDQLSTRNADRGTAMDMIELASHRGWQSLKAKGPEEFRREMWVEGTAQGLKVQGYRPTEKDQEEANRRSQMIGERAIERTDRASQPANAKTTGRENQQGVPRQSYSDGISGKITDIGTAPYRNREGADPVPFVALTSKAGKEEHIWSVTLPAALEKHDLKVGDRATFFSPRVEPVTYKTKDQKTGEEVERQGLRRLWDAKDIERETQPQRATQGTSAAKATTEETPMADKQREQDTKSDRLEDRIKRYEPGDHAAKGPASVLAHMDARLRAEGVSEKDRETARDHAAKLLSQGMKSGRPIPVQKLANVTKEQEAQVRGATAKETRPVPERQMPDQTKGSRSR
ncbi:LPD7 domain-containing protein [Marinibacterium sp. SX1]|uniref:LPD7 domain-containing protein n=1 Tax=Marinibacterium sp. SX1 TaxID=3388424 RepID=UPI003D172254